MTTTLKLKIAMLVGLIIFAGMAVYPSFYPEKTPHFWKTYLAPEGIKQGLDIQGGVHMVLRVKVKEAAKKSLEISAGQLNYALSEENVDVVQIESGDANTIIFALPNTGAVEKIKKLENDFEELDIQVGTGKFPRITVRLKKEEIAFIKNNAVDQSLEIVRNRIDQLGLTEPVIIRQGENEIVVQLPGEKNPQRALDLIRKTAQLEFRLVNEDAGINLQQLINSAVDKGQWDRENDDIDVLNAALKGQLPHDSKIFFEKIKQAGKTIKVPILLKNQVVMTGEMVKDAQVRFDPMNGSYVSLDLTGAGAKIFGQVTEKNVFKRLAIVLDGVVKSAPQIKQKILGGKAQISGSFTTEEASDLAIVLRVGALPAPLEVIQNVTVGASLGEDSIEKGMNSGLFGALLVLLFMVMYYRLSGVIADFALGLNILFLFLGLAMLGATLTLPGIAGIILSIGMAVDANVLIFERMREEFQIGKSVKSGVDSGFDKAFWSIVDSQVTTLITALALFLFGTGPIKGFAVTLSLGIIFNLFAVLFCTRLVYETLYTKRALKELRFMRFIKESRFDFMKIRNLTFGLSGILVIIGLLAFVQILRGHANLGVDFSGGSMLQYKSKKSFQLEDVRAAFKKHDWKSVGLQQVTNENRLIIRIKQAEQEVGHLGDDISKIFAAELPDKNFTLESQSEISSSISAVLRNKAILAIAISLVGVLIYLALRFDFSFGVAAATATFHDVLVVLGICWLFNIEITLLLVTALLTLAGYSLNDSVVVFDRIRENRKKKTDSLQSIINLSINQVLGRTVVTSLTTALVLISLFVYGGQAIHDFSFALLTGVIVGTYSSIFIASPMLSLWPERD